MLSEQIDDGISKWGNKSRCDFSIYTPICQACFAIIVMTMFIICGKGGKGDETSYLSEPWRIVTPALVFFIVMTILAFTNLIIIESGMSTFCDSFKNSFPDISCTTALNRYMSKAFEEVSLSPGKISVILSSVNYIVFFSWLLSVFVLLARILFIVDFQLVRVTVKSIEYENEDAQRASGFKVVEVEDGPNGKEATSQC